MRYPVDNYLTEWNNSAGYDFGDATSYGFHEGKDINDSGGGDSDLGKAIKAIANGELVYYHTYHPTLNFGNHHVYKITGPWGTRWVHEAHCQGGLLAAVQNVTEGQQIASVGKSGTPYAHIHFAVFKVDPATLRYGIDTVARTTAELNAWWEDPIVFIQKWIGGGGTGMANMYRGYDLSNPDSMKVAVDVLIRVQSGDFVDKNKYQALEAEAVELRKRPESCPPVGDPNAADKLGRIKNIVTADSITKISDILKS